MTNIDEALLSTIGYYFFYFIQYISYFIFSFIGSFLKEIYNTNNDYDYEFDPYKVISGSILSTFASVGFRHYYYEYVDWELMSIVSFLFGLIGYEIFTKLTSLEDIFSFIERIKSLSNIIIEPKDKKVDIKKKNKR